MKRFFRVLYWGTLAFCLARLLYLLLFPTPEVDLLNERIAECEYVGQFNEGLAVVKKEGKIGFVDKSGELVIPFKWDYEGNEYSLEEIKFSDGRCCIPNTRNTQAYLIDKEGREIYSGKSISIQHMDDRDVMYVHHEDGGHSVYSMDKESIQKMDALENDFVVIARSWNYNYPGERETYCTLENLCEGNIVGVEKLRNQYGYEYKPYINISLNGVGLVTLLDTKTNKYGIVDEKGNIVVPFQYDNSVCMCYGILIEVICLTLDSDIGQEKYPIGCNIYKDGRLLYENLPYFDELSAHMGMFLFWGTPISDLREKFMLSETDYQFPASVEKTMFVDVNGKEVSRFPFGKNYLRPVNVRSWQLEDKDGKLVYPKKFNIYKRYKNSVSVDLTEEVSSLYITDTGDTIGGWFGSFVNAGIIGVSESFPADFYPLREYDKKLSDEDNYQNCHMGEKSISESFRDENGVMRSKERYAVVTSKGKRLLPSLVDEVSYFSDGLLRLRVGKRYFFVDESGKGMIEM